MRTKDIMTTQVVSVAPETGVSDVAQLLAIERVAPLNGPRIEALDRHQLQGRDAEFPKVWDLLDEAEILSRMANAGRWIDRQPANVGLIEDGLAPGAAQRRVTIPVEAVIGRNADAARRWR
ncbi:MAG: hypothetical protein AB7G08_27815 [Hyphomicrobiaceae bacterium]